MAANTCLASRSRLSCVQAPSNGVKGTQPIVAVSVAVPMGASAGSDAEQKRSVIGRRSARMPPRHAACASTRSRMSGMRCSGPRGRRCGRSPSATSRRAVEPAVRNCAIRPMAGLGSSLHGNIERKVRLRSSVEITARAATSLPSAWPTPATRPLWQRMSLTSNPQAIWAPASRAAAAKAVPRPPSAPRHTPPAERASSWSAVPAASGSAARPSSAPAAASAACSSPGAHSDKRSASARWLQLSAGQSAGACFANGFQRDGAAARAAAPVRGPLRAARGWRRRARRAVRRSASCRARAPVPARAASPRRRGAPDRATRTAHRRSGRHRRRRAMRRSRDEIRGWQEARRDAAGARARRRAGRRGRAERPPSAHPRRRR